MAKEETDYGGSELGQVQVTVIVTSRPSCHPIKELLAGTGVRVGLVLLGLLAAGAAAAIVAVSQSAQPSHAAGRSPGNQSPQLVALYGVGTPFEIPLHCLRLTLVSRDGSYVRADYGTGRCGTYGNYMTVVWHRIHGVWVREFEATGWKCPTTWLPPRVLAELQLCSES
jgi:hypothetical protein